MRALNFRDIWRQNVNVQIYAIDDNIKFIGGA